MADPASRILLFALVAAASAVTLLATAAVLTSRRGRTNGTVYLVGFLLGQSIAFAVALLIGSAATTNRDQDGELAAVLELAFGIALLLVAWPQRRAEADPDAGGPGRVKAMLARLHGLRPGTAFSVGVLLGIGGVKRLSITVLAGRWRRRTPAGRARNRTASSRARRAPSRPMKSTAIHQSLVFIPRE